MKEFIYDNKENITIGIISLITFVIGCLSINIVTSAIIVGILDIIVFIIPPLIAKIKGNKKHNPKVINTNKTISTKRVKMKNPKKENNKKDKVKKFKKRNRIKIFFKVLVILFLLGIVSAIIAAVMFWNYIVKNAPHFDPNELYKQESTLIYDMNGNLIKKLGTEKRENVTYEDLPEVLINAIIATEDSRFFQHNGFDLPRFLKASAQQAMGSDAGGASTLTMQLSKNAYTSKAKSIVRKFTDIYMAIFQIEKEYTKEQILEFYVNYPYLGGGSYGVEQACQTYFGKSVSDINLSEAALIAGLFQSPGAFDPLRFPEKAEARRNIVLYLMERHGYITSEEHDAAKKISVESLIAKENKYVETESSSYEDFIDTVVREIRLDLGIDPYTTPMEIYTTMDPDRQNHVYSVMNGTNFNWENDQVNAGIAVVDVDTGAIVAIGGNRFRDGEGVFNNATQAIRQIGSTSKPIFDYAPGIEFEGWGTGKTFIDEPYHYSNGVTINNWDGDYKGVMTLREALAQSRNVPALKAFQQNKNSNIYDFVTSLGLHPETEDGSTMLHEAHAIGGYTGESPLTMAAAYASFANRGLYTEPYSYTKIVYRNTDEVYEQPIVRRQVMSEETAYIMTSLLQSSAQYGLGNRYYLFNNANTYGAKTGTSNFDEVTKAAKGLPYDAVNDLWVSSTSPDYAISVWYGYDPATAEYHNSVGTIQHTKLFQAVASGIYITGTSFPENNNVISVEIEKGTDPLKLASPQTPEDLRKTELFKKGTEPTEVSTKYIPLDNVTNLKGTLKDKVATITWNSVEKQKDADEAWGNIVYIIYEDKNGNLKEIETVNDTKVEIKIENGGTHKYVIKVAYQNYRDNMSSGNDVTVEVEYDPVFTLKGDTNMVIEAGKTFTDPGYLVKAGEEDITSKAKLKSKVITDTATNKTVNAIDTTKAGKYTISYTLEYNNHTKVLTRTVTVNKPVTQTQTETKTDNKTVTTTTTTTTSSTSSTSSTTTKTN